MKNRLTALLLLFLLLFTTHYACTQKGRLAQDKNPGEIAIAEVKERLERGEEFVILDVRTKAEYESVTGHLEGAILIPIQELDQRYHELDSLKDREIVAYCRTGNRSGRAAKFLTEKGFKIYNMVGGILEWNKAIEEFPASKKESK